MGVYQKAEGIQSYLRIKGNCDPIESVPPDLKNGGCMVVVLKQMHIAGPKMGLTVASKLVVQQSQHKNVVFLVSLHDGYNKFG